MKILVTGVNGLVGNSLIKVLSKSNHEIFKSSRRIEGLADYKVDVTSKDDLELFFAKFDPDVVINSAAMADVDLCETEKKLCDDVNINGVRNLVDICLKYNCHLTHISTDYIFDGQKKSGVYLESDIPNPQGYYAKSKLEGEKIITSSDVKFSILRTILVYGLHEKLNIVTFIKKSLEEGNAINLVDDQIRMPTYVDDLSEACVSASEKNAIGIFNICGAEQMSYLEIGNRIADYFSLDKKLINHVKTKDLNQRALRPFKTGFDLEKSIKFLGYNPISFNNSLELMFNKN
jgi:dTDP-4-dehydrorhamnose reductase